MTKTAKDLKNYLHEKSKKDFPVDNETVEEVVRKVVDFPNGSNGSWNAVYCAVCGDGSRTKGPRGGWKFEGENAAYNCFNCGIKGAFSPEEEIPMSTHMKEIFTAFGIPKREYAKILFRVRDADKSFTPLKKKEEVDPFSILKEKSFELPDYLIPLNECEGDPRYEKSLELLEKKCIDHRLHTFYLSTGKTESTNPQNKINAKITLNRLIIPITMGDRVLLLQARVLSGKHKNKYINIGTISNCLYGIDSLREDHKYIFVTEGYWDAVHVNGVATITNQLTKPQVQMLESIDKPKVVVPDRNGDYNVLAEKAVEQGWGIAAPRELKNYKDVTQAVRKYGRLYVIHALMNSVTFGDKAKLVIKSL